MANTVRAYRRLLSEAAGIAPADLPGLGARVGDAVAARWPDLVEEVEGIAAGAGQRTAELLAINARTELLGPEHAAECSVVGRLDGRGVRLAQNWDWHPALAPSRVVWTVEPPGGRWFTTVTEAGILGKLGLNGGGLACGLSFLTCSVDGGPRGVPVHVLLRVVLDRCTTVLEALALLERVEVSASSCVTLAGVDGADPALLAVELSPGGTAVVWPDADGVLVHTNHFLIAPTAGEDTQPREHPGTLLRRWRLQRALAEGADLEAALRSHFPAPEGVCRHDAGHDPWPERRATLLSVEMDPGAPRLWLADGPPCEAAYAEVPLP